MKKIISTQTLYDMRILFRIAFLGLLIFVVYQSDLLEAAFDEWEKALNHTLYKIRETNRSLTADQQRSTTVWEILLFLVNRKLGLLIGFTMVIIYMLGSLVSFSKLPSLFTAMLIGGAIDDNKP